MSGGDDLFAGVELGGTKTILSLGREGRIVTSETLPTDAPDRTLAAANAILRRWSAQHPLRAIGIAAFGPVAVDPLSAEYGRTLATPKPGWDDVNLIAGVMAELNRPSAFDTDVNAAALAEYRWGAGAGLDAFWYITIGTGIGGGMLVNGRPFHGAMHPEIGHMHIVRSSTDGFAGTCPFHGDCVEGLASGSALAARFGEPVEKVGDDDPRWHAVAADLSGMIATLLLTTSPRAILFGGTVSLSRRFLLPLIRQRTLERLAGYLPFLSADSVMSIIRLAALGTNAGPLGALALAESAIDSAK